MPLLSENDENAVGAGRVGQGKLDCRAMHPLPVSMPSLSPAPGYRGAEAAIRS